jgi:hypothetical protein
MKELLWLLFAERTNPKVPSVVPTLAWFAEEQGAKLEIYLESSRDGRLFAQHGSTVLGGRHFQQFNYLHVTFDLRYILLGRSEVFRSSRELWGVPVLAHADSATDLYAAFGIEGERVVLPDTAPPEGMPDLRPYFYPEVLFRRALGIPAAEGGPSEEPLSLPDDTDYRDFTVGLAEKWLAEAKGLAFGDPDAILAMLATLCRERRVAVFGKRQKLAPSEIEANVYAEEHSSACGDVRRMCAQTGNRVIVGGQTCDGDLFEWSRSGVAIQIMDPNRPAFPVVAEAEHRWARRGRTVYSLEPEETALGRWADEGKCLASLLVHSGEIAHNEAMLNLIELCGLSGLKLGIGVHAARYETCPQLWELIAVEQEHGGALGLVEPILHTGGQGILTENTCPLDLLAEHCGASLERISEICGKDWQPRGYLTFMDSDMGTFTRTMPDLYALLSAQGFHYSVSCALPGRNRVIHRDARHITLNQSSRSIATGSPYVRVTLVDDLTQKSPGPRPGWWLGVIDSPPVAFNPYIWRRGNRFMEIVDWLTGGSVINVTPNVVARYARLLAKRGLVPEGVSPA